MRSVGKADLKDENRSRFGPASATCTRCPTPRHAQIMARLGINIVKIESSDDVVFEWVCGTALPRWVRTTPAGWWWPKRRLTLRRTPRWALGWLRPGETRSDRAWRSRAAL